MTADELIDSIYEDERLNECCSNMLPRIEAFIEKHRKMNRMILSEIIDKIRSELLNGNIETVKHVLEERMGVITVTYKLGSRGLDVAKEIAKRSGYRMVYQEILEEAAKRLDVPEWKVEKFDEFKYVPSKLSFLDIFRLDKGIIDLSGIFGGKSRKRINIDEFRAAISKAVLGFAISNNVIIVGHGAACILKDYPNALHLKVSAPFDDRVKEYSQRLSVPIDEAEKQLSMIDDREKSFYKDLCNANVGGIELFHLELNSSKFSVEDATDVAMKAFKLVVKEQQ